MAKLYILVISFQGLFGVNRQDQISINIYNRITHRQDQISINIYNSITHRQDQISINIYNSITHRQDQISINSCMLHYSQIGSDIYVIQSGHQIHLHYE